MKKEYSKYLKYVLPALILIGLFYWYQIRPARIRSVCVTLANDSARKQLLDEVDGSGGLRDLDDVAEMGDYMTDTYNFYYQRCLNEKGLR